MKTTLLFLSVFLSATLFGQNVYIPDANFKTYLVVNFDINTNEDNEIQVSEASAFDGLINCIDLGISDLTGVEAFTALTGLQCSYNQLTSLDVSQNTALTLLECSGNQLTSLDVSQNTVLGVLHCSNNQLTVLDVSANTELYELEFESTQVQSIDLSQNTDLWWLACGDSPLVSLDISNSNSLEFLYAGGNQLNCLNAKNGNNGYITDFMVYSSPNLTCIEVDDAEWSTDNWMFIDPQMYFSENCNYPENCDDSSVGINQLSTSKNLIQILDLMGRETSFKPNTPLIYVYDDGSVEKVFSVEY